MVGDPAVGLTSAGTRYRGRDSANDAAAFDGRVKMGFRELVNYDAFGITFPANTVTTLRQTIAKRPELIENFLKTLIEGIHIFKTNKAKSLAVMKRNLTGRKR